MSEPGRHDTFASDWLALREPADHRSRSASLVRRLDEVGRARGWSRLLDLGAGRGSNVRYLAPRLGWARSWTALDHDAGLLAELAAAAQAGATTIEGDLRAEGLDAVAGCDVVTASALLDLVSEAWVAALAARVAAARCAVLIALSWDGTFAWGDPHDADALVLGAVRRHQTGEKGMGAALGPRAVEVTSRALHAVGLEVTIEPTPWMLSGTSDAGLALELLDGWVRAAMEARPDARAEIEAWGARRAGSIRAGDWSVRVGHDDLLALPPVDSP